MLDLKFILENRKLIEENCRARNMQCDLDSLSSLLQIRVDCKARSSLSAPTPIVLQTILSMATLIPKAMRESRHRKK